MPVKADSRSHNSQHMYNPSVSGGNVSSVAGSRLFVYEVKGLRQNAETDKINTPIRKSGSVFITVPYNRMNQEMQRITRLGGEIGRASCRERV